MGLASSSSADDLLPGRAPGRRFVVYFGAGDPASDAEGRALCRAFREARWPADLTPVEVDVERAPELLAHFGLRRLPAVAIVEDGSLVALEYACTPEARDFLLSVASSQRRRAYEDDDL
ncbi:MAG: hypothetical protein D6729_01880 [Deltaproteobacteria bacterium]|nr:MAG: hypothetical protein D6729_01880 [Deltaproteobacteria bacterium]